ncbi:MAG: 30S ribosomal protein S6e [Candidatus Diapherotrites archaeon]|uniref:30S ribosomal protein S6e n=1 Tax=Candidatus Iainarchaeum sp. TaxID=3101447 RepID=A0A7J4IU69_9ARCH|nr:MAG: 30S ribosomal protein S6e, small subunit ribosomal protein S6e [archaeon GW2011_AR10]MBS3059580.1 30S ribosomal protein S6e [Candidatus Diapherotrites archaeon]HIH08370.1 30S ribosomal protein S6e [Candidatus Diapherotrites archaeon]
MNIVISDPKTGKAYSKKIEGPELFLNKKVGQQVALNGIGLDGYEAKITGGSDKQGFPMKADLEGTGRRKVLLVKQKNKGIRRRISFRGNMVSRETQQLNLLVTKTGAKNLDELIGVKEKKEEETQESIKEKMIKKSLEMAGTTEAAKVVEEAELKKGVRKR